MLAIVSRPNHEFGKGGEKQMQELVDKHGQFTKTAPVIPAMPQWLKEEILEESEEIWRCSYEVLERISHSGQEIALETAMKDQSLAIGRKILEAVIACALGTGYQGPSMACSFCHKAARFVEHRAKRLVTLLGTIRLKRAYYHCPDCAKGTAPLDERLWIKGCRFSAAAFSAVCRSAACASFRDAARLLKELAAMTVDKKTIRLAATKKGRELEEMTQQEILGFWQNPKFSPRWVQANPQRLYSLADGAMINIRKEGWKEVKVAAVFEADIPKKRKRPQRQEATYAATLEDSQAFGKRFYVETVKRGLPEAKEVVPIADGAHWIWNEAREHFPQEKTTEIIDLYHAKEKIHGAAALVFGETSIKGKRWAHRWAKTLEKGKVNEVVAAIKRLKPKTKEAKEKTRQTVGYFRGNKLRMDYGRFKRQGYFVGSGVVEAACKNLVGQRMKGPGMRWSRGGAQAILQLRVTHLNNRWELTWVH